MQVCYKCLAGISGEPISKGGCRFCSDKCASAAWDQFLKVESTLRPEAFVEHCMRRDEVNAMLAARHVFSKLQNPVRIPFIGTPGGTGRGGEER